MLACPSHPKGEFGLFADLWRSTLKPLRRLAISLSVSLATSFLTKPFAILIFLSGKGLRSQPCCGGQRAERTSPPLPFRCPYLPWKASLPSSLLHKPVSGCEVISL